ncbi:MAG TPA: acetate uptake transporter [Flexivirga sp.]|uniref:acetate uptake transporter n=1 Tax=Flexivirga sp. TaxID=1962927 RepID=UPI002B70765A|nr:acetate uptake transporter [Flexivirga sp.]HWC22658.1 acetate uptake transporter [Flexivirga sp.]
MSETTTRPAPGSHIADPAALGLGAFALTTFVLSVVNAGIVPEKVEPVVFGLAFAYGGIAQLAAGIWEFAKGNTFGATAFCSYGAFWLSFWWLTGHTDLSGAGSDVNKGLGIYLLAWGIFTLYMTIAAIRVSGAVLLVFVLLTITYFLLAFGEFGTSSGLTKTGGYVGILTAIAAWYASFATVVNFTFKRTVMPTLPR